MAWPRLSPDIPQKMDIPQKVGQKAFFVNTFFLLFQKLILTLLAKNQVPICLLSLSKFNIEYLAEIQKKVHNSAKK